ncbi:hypothetical protein D3C86_1574530 [compost metagenome]
MVLPLHLADDSQNLLLQGFARTLFNGTDSLVAREAFRSHHLIQTGMCNRSDLQQQLAVHHPGLHLGSA